jgi:uncharacterized repeat protein (TIGR03803 family)
MFGKPVVTSSGLILVLFSALFMMAARSAQAQSETVLYTFCASGFGCSDGASPNSPLTSDGKGNLYGATIIGGDAGQFCGCGTVFELSPNGSGGWNDTVLYSFAGEAGGGAWPTGPLVFDTAGNI